MPEIIDSQLFIKDILSPVLTELNIKDDCNLDIFDSTSKAEGYIGKIWRAKVKQGNEEIVFIIKLACEEENHRDFTKADVLYRNEVCFYTKVFPAMDKLQKDKNIKQPFKIAKCYATSLKEKQEAVVLEDLKAAGFEMHDRKKPLDEAHISLVLTQYGKLHALSLALRDQQPEVFKRISSSMTDAISLIYPSFVGGFSQQAEKNVEMLKQRGLIAEAQLAQKVFAELDEICCVPCDVNSPYNIITHGDCWSNNIMFKYANSGKPIDVRFLDFQISRLHSPGFELAHFLYLSAPKRVMDEIDKYLIYYHKALSDFLRQLGSDPDVLLPFEVLLKDWRKYRTFGLAMSLFCFRFMLSEEDEAVSLTTKEDYKDKYGKEISNQEEQDKRVIDVVKHFVEQKVTW